MSDWYDCIEEPIRPIVKHLRDNGFNTTCSCGHEMYVEGEMGDLGRTYDLYLLVYNWGWRDFEIIVEVHVETGFVTRESFLVKQTKPGERVIL